MNSLHTKDHRLNYDEAVRRLEYWASIVEDSAGGPLRILAILLRRDRDNLYFETKTCGKEAQ